LFKTLPLHQFQYLIEQKKFTEAEELAQKFAMDEEVSFFSFL
jgi:hypothetical protein